MRPLWSGSIAFGLVNVPIKLYSATVSDHGVNLDMLHKSDLSPIRYARICKADGKEVAWKDIVKGYEIGDGQYVPITEADLKQASSKKSSAIEIDQPMSFSAPSVAILENEIYHANKPVEIQRKIILVGTCRNCDHMPMGVNKLVAVLSLAIAVLSGMLIYSSSPTQFRMPAISMNTLTDWVTPASHVKNL